VRDAGTRASEAIASVELATALYPLGGAAAPEARLARALAARGAVAVTIRRDDGPEGQGVELAVVASGELMRVRITAAPEREREHGGWRAEGIRAITVTAGDLATPERTEELAALLCGGGELP